MTIFHSVVVNHCENAECNFIDRKGLDNARRVRKLEIEKIIVKWLVHGPLLGIGHKKTEIEVDDDRLSINKECMYKYVQINFKPRRLYVCASAVVLYFKSRLLVSYTKKHVLNTECIEIRSLHPFGMDKAFTIYQTASLISTALSPRARLPGTKLRQLHELTTSILLAFQRWFIMMSFIYIHKQRCDGGHCVVSH